MTRPLSNDLRERIIRRVEGGLSRHVTAEKFDVSVSAVVKLLQQWKTTGSYQPQQIGGYRKPILAAHVERVKSLLEEKPDITIAELQRRLAAVRVKVGQSSISRFLIHLGQSYKKNRSRRRTRPGRR